MPHKNPALILLDLEGFSCQFDKNGEISYPLGKEKITVSTTEPEARFGAYQGAHLGAIVCVAFNQDTARKPLVGFSFLGRLAHNIARRFGVRGDVVCEIALCFTAPESADIALFRLLEHAPHAHHAGPFSSVFLLSTDHGLCRSFNARFSFGNRSLHPKKSNWLGWQIKNGYTRSAPPTAQTSPSLPPPQGHSVPIDHPSHAVWASTQPVEIGLSAPISSEELWQQLLHAIEATPHLLSQISTTQHSTRGTLRNTPALCHAPDIGECSEKDGLFIRHLPSSELLRSTTETLASSRVVDDSLAPGAIHLTAKRMTLRTRLPSDAIIDIIRCLESSSMLPLRHDTHQVDDARAVQALPLQATFGHIVSVSVSVSSPQAQPMRWKVERSRNNMQRAWWWSESSATSCCVLRWSNAAPRQPFQVKAQMRKEGNAIVMSIPLGCRKAEPIESIAPWTLGLAQSTQGIVALLALDAPLQKGHLYDIIPVQDRSRPVGLSLFAKEARNRWADLQKCPIGVVFCQKLPRENVSST